MEQSSQHGDAAALPPGKNPVTIEYESWWDLAPV